jgi:pyrroloquinoline quinone biosynthesis protein D
VSAASATPKRNERVAARIVDGKALIVVIDGRELHVLNAVGTRVWELCDGRSVDAIVATVTEEFEVDAATALHDVQEFIADLYRVGALESEHAP